MNKGERSFISTLMVNAEKRAGSSSAKDKLVSEISSLLGEFVTSRGGWNVVERRPQNIGPFWIVEGTKNNQTLSSIELGFEASGERPLPSGIYVRAQLDDWTEHKRIFTVHRVNPEKTQTTGVFSILDSEGREIINLKDLRRIKAFTEIIVKYGEKHVGAV